MDRDRLRAEGYPEIRTNEMSANRRIEGTKRTYRAGEAFAMKAGCPHIEDIGPPACATWWDAGRSESRRADY